MKWLLIGIFLLSTTRVLAQSGQAPAMQQSTSTTNTRQANPPKMKPGRSGQMPTDSTRPRNKKQQRLAPDSLRRGGATRVDTVRR